MSVFAISVDGDRFQSTLPRGERHFSASGDPDPSTISIHAPARGATQAPVPDQSSPQFQSTLPRGERHSVTPITYIFCMISIHAPARGATVERLRIICISESFQSTLPRGERLGSIDIFIACANFNPRSREGSDHVPMHQTNHL